MATTVTTTTTCDFCGYGGPLSRPHDFRRIGDVDLCRWCAQPDVWGALESRGHLVTFTEDTWSCSCGGQYRPPLYVSPRVLAAIPNVLNATAHVHTEGV